jgi:hypothetical protein
MPKSYVKLTENILMAHTVLPVNTNTADGQVQLQHNDMLLATIIKHQYIQRTHGMRLVSQQTIFYVTNRIADIKIISCFDGYYTHC